jgi:hypothetical protein
VFRESEPQRKLGIIVVIPLLAHHPPEVFQIHAARAGLGEKLGYGTTAFLLEEPLLQVVALEEVSEINEPFILVATLEKAFGHNVIRKLLGLVGVGRKILGDIVGQGVGDCHPVVFDLGFGVRGFDAVDILDWTDLGEEITQPIKCFVAVRVVTVASRELELVKLDITNGVWSRTNTPMIAELSGKLILVSRKGKDVSLAVLLALGYLHLVAVRIDRFDRGRWLGQSV